jgi:hypothetical protein
MWTTSVPENSLRITPFGELATLDLVDLPISDSFDKAFGPTNLPAKATLHVEWLPGVDTYTYRSAPGKFAGNYFPALVRIEWSASGATSATDATPYTFRSGPEQRTTYAQVGREVTGTFVDAPR